MPYPSKVLHIITGLEDGGAEAVLYSLCSSDKKISHTVVSLMGNGKYGPFLRDIGVEVFCLEQRPGRFSLAAFFRLTRIIKSQNPDVIQTWMYHANVMGSLCALAAGCRKIYWSIHHSKFDKVNSSFVRKAIFFISVKLSWHVSKKIIYCSKSNMNQHLKDGFDPGKSLFIPNGYDLSRFFPDAAKKASWKITLNIDPNKKVFGIVGRYIPDKDHANLISALEIVNRKYSDYCCLFIGSDLNESNTQLISDINKHGLSDQIILIGPQRDIPGIMCLLDLHILSSNCEAFPNVLNEAMACGTPCVTTDVGDAAFIVGDTGWVSPPQNPEALAGKILEAIAAMGDSEAYALRRIAARMRISDNFSIQAMIANYHKAWGFSE